MLNAPDFWYRPKGWQARLLSPLAAIYGGAVARRQRGATPHRADVPVISVGNINVGGTGKTPTVIALQSMLSEIGKTPHVITRGYGGPVTGPHAVGPRDTADDVGDEAVLLSAFGPVWVARDRAAGARAAKDAGVLILDDGLQNPSLLKDLSICVVDLGVGFGNGCVFPAGPLRERVARGLSRVDLVLGIGTEDQANALKNEWPALGGVPFYRAELRPLQTGMDWQGLRALAFAGIGRPQKFYDTLAGLGADVVATRSFGDHQKIPEQMLRRLQAEAVEKSAQLVTTEKDAARLPRDWQQKVLTLPVRLHIEKAAEFTAALQKIL